MSNYFDHLLSCLSQECISQSALVTKFAHHVSNAGVIVCDLRRQWTELHATSQRCRLLQEIVRMVCMPQLKNYHFTATFKSNADCRLLSSCRHYYATFVCVIWSHLLNSYGLHCSGHAALPDCLWHHHRRNVQWLHQTLMPPKCCSMLV